MRPRLTIGMEKSACAIETNQVNQGIINSIGELALRLPRHSLAISGVISSLLVMGASAPETNDVAPLYQAPVANYAVKHTSEHIQTHPKLHIRPHWPKDEHLARIKKPQPRPPKVSSTLSLKVVSAISPRKAESVLEPTKLQLKTANSFNTNSSSDCTIIADFPSGFFEGEDCLGDIFYKMHESKPAGYSYGMFIISGIYKCGWVKDNKVLTFKASPQIFKSCQKYFRPLTNKPNLIIEDPNCKPGACQDGSFKKLKNRCNHTFDRNYAPKYVSPLNLLPEGRPSGLMQPEGEQYHSVLYRFTSRLASVAGKADIVRSTHIGWGYMTSKCLEPGYLLSFTAKAKTARERHKHEHRHSQGYRQHVHA